MRKKKTSSVQQDWLDRGTLGRLRSDDFSALILNGSRPGSRQHRLPDTSRVTPLGQSSYIRLVSETVESELDLLCDMYLLAAYSRPVDVNRRDGSLKNARLLLQVSRKQSHPWFERALLDRKQQLFAAAVLHGALPRALLRPMLRAATRGPDASTNQAFVRPALKSFSVKEVRQILLEEIDAIPSPSPREKQLAESALYWLHAAAEFEAEKLRSAAQKMPLQQRCEHFITADIATKTAIVYQLPWRDRSLSTHYRELLERAADSALATGDAFLIGQLGVAQSG